VRTVSTATVSGVLVLLGCAGLVRPVGAALEGDTCHSQIIVRLAHGQGSSPDRHFVTQLARATDVHLTFLRALGAGLYSFALSSADRDPGCRRALERLSRDPRVRSAEIDMRRRAQS